MVSNSKREGLKKRKTQNLKNRKKTKVSKIPRYRIILLKLMMEWKLLEQRVDRSQQSTFYSAQNKKKRK